MHHSGLKTGLRALLITALAATVGACGMKGALYLPEQQPQSQPQSTTGTAAETRGEKGFAGQKSHRYRPGCCHYEFCYHEITPAAENGAVIIRCKSKRIIQTLK